MEKEDKEIVETNDDKKSTDEYLMDTVDYTELFRKEFGTKDGEQK